MLFSRTVITITKEDIQGGACIAALRFMTDIDGSDKTKEITKHCEAQKNPINHQPRQERSTNEAFGNEAFGNEAYGNEVYGVDMNVRQSQEGPSTPLGTGYQKNIVQLGEWDVIHGVKHGKQTHPGNMFLIQLLEQNHVSPNDYLWMHFLD